MKKFLIIGFGNIGQRHFRNLKKIFPEVEINICTTKRDNYRIFDNDLNITLSNSLTNYYPINNIFYNVAEALTAENYDAVFICSLPPERIDIAIETANRGFNLFIEKPLSNNLDKVYKLREIVENKKVKCAIGYQMRFHPIIQKIKNMIKNEEFGHIYRVEISHCNDIYNWVKGRKNLHSFYALKKETGGGVVLSQIHEIDYSFYLFGKHYPISAIYGNMLGFEVEDNISIMSNLENDGRCTPIVINLDFLSKIPTRKVTIYGIEKTETFDLLTNNSDEWNNLFLKEMKAFIDLLEDEKHERLATLEDGIVSLEYICDIKDNFIKI